VKIAGAALDAIGRHARATAPDECCGLLVGKGDEITLSIATRNAAAQPRRRYQIEAADHFSVIRRARQLRLDVVGAYHSHPHSPAVPSETDRKEAFEDFTFVIVGPDEVRAWRLISGNFVEVPLVRVP
jgi:proteasome lid subunit RPN8/RPN11